MDDGYTLECKATKQRVTQIQVGVDGLAVVAAKCRGGGWANREVGTDRAPGVVGAIFRRFPVLVSKRKSWNGCFSLWIEEVPCVSGTVPATIVLLPLWVV